jgi:hypothetical protein
MVKEILKNKESAEKLQKQPEDIKGEKLEKLDVDSHAIDVVEGVESAESSEDESVFDEKQKKYVQKQNKQAPVPGDATSRAASVAAAPSIENMVKQTVMAIEEELKKTEIEVKRLIKNKSSSPHTINEKVIRIRFLNGLLSKLQRAAKLTQDFIVGLWKQYVKKMS